MRLDVRLPVGLLFTAIGIALCLYGALGDPAIYQRSLGINVNLRWGAVLLVFGVLMLLFAWRDRAAQAEPHSSPRRETWEKTVAP
jgi:hypothetical protein